MPKRSKVARGITHSYNEKPKANYPKTPNAKPKEFVHESCFKGDKRILLALAALLVGGYMTQIMTKTSHNEPNKPNNSNSNGNNKTTKANQKAACARFEETTLKLRAECPPLSPQEQQNQGLFFSPHVRAGVHPGLYMLSNNIKSTQEWQYLQIEHQTVIVKDKNYSPETIYKIAEQIAKRLRMTYEFDQTYKEAGAADRFWHDKALDWLEKEVLYKPLETFKKDELHTILQTLNFLTLAPDESHKSHIEGNRSIYRTKEMFIRKSPDVPNFYEGDAWLKFLEKKDPKNIPTFKRFAEYYNERIERRVPVDQFLEFIDGKKDLEVSIFARKYYRWCPKGNEIKKLMDDFIESLTKKLNILSLPENLRALRSKPNIDPIEVAAYAHMQLVAIHPFLEGNGRTARALMNTILMQQGLKPVTFLKNEHYMDIVWQSIEKRDYKLFENLLHTEIQKANTQEAALENMADEMENCQKTLTKIVDMPCQKKLSDLMRKIESGNLTEAQLAAGSQPEARAVVTPSFNKAASQKKPGNKLTSAQRKAKNQREVRRR